MVVVRLVGRATDEPALVDVRAPPKAKLTHYPTVALFVRRDGDGLRVDGGAVAYRTSAPG